MANPDDVSVFLFDISRKFIQIYLTHAGLLARLRISTATQAEVAELVDALASGASGGNPVEVQVLSSAPLNNQRFPICFSHLARNNQYTLFKMQLFESPINLELAPTPQPL